jgi:hypothetical protein
MPCCSGASCCLLVAATVVQHQIRHQAQLLHQLKVHTCHRTWTRQAEAMQCPQTAAPSECWPLKLLLLLLALPQCLTQRPAWQPSSLCEGGMKMWCKGADS